ncbi:thioredoxin family protein [Lewinella sp. IMCC34191]|uniref:thioredoxin family protein n=1 Tax=Lewinella sp. IMCC34191 TaxID=2259172 RepID=UPI0013006F8B|nr:thioredoxin family protein [Lewinella sp. IMCC34191]
MRYLLILPLLFVCLCLTAQGDRSIAFAGGSWEEALQQAKAADKPVFLFAYTKSCHFCRQMERDVFTDSTVAAYYNDHFLSYRIDIEDGAEGEALSDQYGINAFPTYVFLSAEGEMLHQSASAKPAADFIQDAKDAGDPDRAIFSLMRRYDGGDRSPDLLFNYATALIDYKRRDSPQETVVGEYLATQSPEQLTSDATLRLLFDTYLPFASPATQHFLEHHEAYLPLFGREEVDRKLRYTIRNAASTAGRDQDDEQLTTIKATLAQHFPDEPSMTALTEIYYYQGAADWLAYARATLRYASAAGKVDEAPLIETAKYLRHFAEEQQVFELGAQLMRQITDKEPTYENLLLLAEMQDGAEQPGEALQTAEEALRVAADSGEDDAAARELIVKLASDRKG